MKKLVFLLLVPWLCSGQTITFPPGKIASEEYVRKYVDSVLAARPVVEVPPVVTLPGKAELVPCDRGPTIESISAATEQGLLVKFDGKNVFGLDWQIFAEDKTLRSGSIEPSSNTLGLIYDALPAGAYTLRLSGNTCQGVSTREFTIEKFSGSVNPPKIPDPTDDGTVKPVAMSESWPGILDVRISGSSNNWKIADVSTVELRDGYEWQYLVNSDIVRTDKNLTDYPYPGNAPVRVQKQAIKKGVESLARWPTHNETSSWYDKDASYAFGPISDVGGVTFYYFTNGWQPQSGDLTWVNPVPANWQPQDYSSWPEVAPAISLPESKVYIQNPHAAGQTISQVMRLGVTHYSAKWQHTETGLPQGRLYNDVPQTRALLRMRIGADGNYVKSFTEAEAREAGRSVAIPDIWIGETYEGDDFISADAPVWGWFYDELGKRYQKLYQQDKKLRYIGHNYFDILPGEYATVNKSLPDLRWVYTTPTRNLPRGVFAGNLKNTNTHVTGWYKNAPDEMGYVYKRLFNMQVSRKLGLHTGVFLFPVHEWVPGFSWQVTTTNPAGKLSQSDKAPLPPSELVTAAFLGLDEGDIAIVWETDFQRSKNPNDATTSWMGGKRIWQPVTGSPSEFPYKTQSPTFPGYPQWVYDFFHWGILLYHATSQATDGGESRYADFRIDGGNWIEARPDGSDLLDAWNERRGLAKVTKKGDIVTVSYLNPFADNKPHSIEIRSPFNASQTWSGQVFSDMIHAVNLTL